MELVERNELWKHTRKLKSRTLHSCIVLIVCPLFILVKALGFIDPSLSLAASSSTMLRPMEFSSESSYRVGTTSKSPRFAIVHLIDSFRPIYVSALLSSVHHAVWLHSNVSDAIFSGQLDLCVLVPESLNLTGYEHPYIRYVPFNGDPIRKALEGTAGGGLALATYLKLLVMTLDDYDKVIFLDLDVVVFSQLASILLDVTPPAMVQWGEYPKLNFNGGVHILRPSQEMFQDALQALEKLGPSRKAINELRAMSTFDALEKEIPKDPSKWAGYRGDQEFLFAFYDILPETRVKWGPLRNLPYRYNAREQSVSDVTNFLLHRRGSSVRGAAAIYNSAHSHLFGGYGHDGRGHRLNPTLKEDGMFGLVAVHMTTRKPWSEQFQKYGGHVNGGDDDEHDKKDGNMNITTRILTPQERCPDHIFQMYFWEGVMDGMMEALHDPRFGNMWISNSSFDHILSFDIVRRCFAPNLDSLLAEKENLLSKSTTKQVCKDTANCRMTAPSRVCQERCTSEPPRETNRYIPLIDNR